ncbi:unnamed protein product [Parascedosporium putredinis]|uniref:Mannose-6-phosphate isomerase n=1 Tax=Parascedosporium putredinis TaxID=1442378 RepID=A0A9P1GX26_9PEZI|nr:unnamed protein product [Parascedosporium putredinis]CAI7990156.1 unnamed protein product [Parascedosporium putredinis]
MTPKVIQLSGSCNNYPWGRKGFQIDDDKVYSEMWFGDYPDFPAKSVETGEPLADILKKHQVELLGENVVKNLDAQLPFLPKILSISKALPLQIHPNKELSDELHKKDPEKFTDPNHKPEIAVALSKFEVFAGWKPLSVVSVLLNIPSLRRFIPEGTTSWTNDTLKEVVRGLLKADEALVKEVEDDLKRRPRSELDHLGAVRVHRPRVLVALLCMNFLVLEPGEALFIPADGIHAYLSGDIVECMARSNNVLNSGFCPRADRDSIDLFAETLTFKALGKKDIMLPAKDSESGAKGYTVEPKPLMNSNKLVSGRYPHFCAATEPPSTNKSAPVINELSTLARNATARATSSDVPILRTGAPSTSLHLPRRRPLSSPRPMAVDTTPGLTVLTRAPLRPHATAAACTLRILALLASASAAGAVAKCLSISADKGRSTRRGKGVDDVRGADEVDGQDAVGRGLRGDTPAVCTTASSAARGGLGERGDGGAVGYVDFVRLELEALGAKGGGGLVERGGGQVGEQEEAAGTEAAGDGEAYSAEAGDGDDFEGGVWVVMVIAVKVV